MAIAVTPCSVEENKEEHAKTAVEVHKKGTFAPDSAEIPSKAGETVTDGTAPKKDSVLLKTLAMLC